jgi:hypothetical protein
MCAKWCVYHFTITFITTPEEMCELDEAAQAESVGIARLQRRLRRSLSPLDAARDAGGLSNEREGAAELQRMRHARQDGGAEHSPRLSNALDAKPTGYGSLPATRVRAKALERLHTLSGRGAEQTI